MKEHNEHRAKAEKALMEKEECIKVLTEKIRTYKKEVDAWRGMCVVTWNKDPKLVYDPTKPQMDVEIDKEEDESSGFFEITETPDSGNEQ